MMFIKKTPKSEKQSDPFLEVETNWKLEKEMRGIFAWNLGPKEERGLGR